VQLGRMKLGKRISRKVRKRQQKKDHEKHDEDDEEDDEEDEKVMVSDPGSYSKHDIVLVRPTVNDSKEKYWIGRLEEDVEKDQDVEKKVKIWWYGSFFRKVFAVNRDNGAWEGLMKEQGKGKPVRYIDGIWRASLDAVVYFTVTNHLTVTSLKVIHGRVNDWRIANRIQVPEALLSQVDSESPPNPNFYAPFSISLQRTPPSFVMPIVTLTEHAILSACFCIACPVLQTVTHACKLCFLPLCLTHFYSHYYFVHMSTTRKLESLL
jgi:hypothetical protein